MQDKVELLVDDSSTDSDSDLGVLSSVASNCSSITDVAEESVPGGLQALSKNLASGIQVGQEEAAHQLTAAHYTERLIQDEAARDLVDYPSLDPTVQQEIAQKYQLLHARVQEAGLYKCNHWAYAKEATRYLGLFAGFLYALRSEWYLTAAMFLGLFWVCYSSSPSTGLANSSAASNHVYSA